MIRQMFFLEAVLFQLLFSQLHQNKLAHSDSGSQTQKREEPHPNKELKSASSKLLIQ